LLLAQRAHTARAPLMPTARASAVLFVTHDAARSPRPSCISSSGLLYCRFILPLRWLPSWFVLAFCLAFVARFLPLLPAFCLSFTAPSARLLMFYFAAATSVTTAFFCAGSRYRRNDHTPACLPSLLPSRHFSSAVACLPRAARAPARCRFAMVPGHTLITPADFNNNRTRA